MEAAAREAAEAEAEAAKRATEQQASGSSSSAAGGSDAVSLALPYRSSLSPYEVSGLLQGFLRGLFPHCDRAMLRAHNAGGGGNCLFHATAAALEYMLQDDVARQNHVLKFVQLADFGKGKRHLVQLLRGMVADRLEDWENAAFLNLLVTSVLQKRSNAEWYDAWNPLRELRVHGFDMLRHEEVETVLVAEPDEQGAGDLMLIYRTADARLPEDRMAGPSRAARERTVRVENGMAKLFVLRQTVSDIFSTYGNDHWGTVTDVGMLMEALDIGFFVFSNNEMGLGRWIYGVHRKKETYPYWITLYLRNNQHFVLAEVYDEVQQKYTCFFPDDKLPAALREHWELCNTASRFAAGMS